MTARAVLCSQGASNAKIFPRIGRLKWRLKSKKGHSVDEGWPGAWVSGTWKHYFCKASPADESFEKYYDERTYEWGGVSLLGEG